MQCDIPGTEEADLNQHAARGACTSLAALTNVLEDSTGSGLFQMLLLELSVFAFMGGILCTLLYGGYLLCSPSIHLWASVPGIFCPTVHYQYGVPITPKRTVIIGVCILAGGARRHFATRGRNASAKYEQLIRASIRDERLRREYEAFERKIQYMQWCDEIVEQSDGGPCVAR